MPEIFLSYRRSDSAGSAGRLFDRLAEHFGSDQVFRDVDSIEAGENFEETIRDALRVATVVLIVIGPRWLEAQGKDGSRRVDDTNDYVRREIELALSSHVAIIPVRVEGASLPEPGSLPTSIKALALSNDWELSNRRWDRETQELINHLEARLGISPYEPATSPDGGRSKQLQSLAQVGLAALAGFFPNLFLLFAKPRRFLARYSRGRSSDVLATIVFCLLAVLTSDIVLTPFYTPRESVVGFYMSGVELVVLFTMAVSAPLWLAWRLVGATRHYVRLIVILLHQVAAIHLLTFVMGGIMFAGMELRSTNAITRLLEEARKEPSLSATLEVLARRSPSLFGGPVVLIASGLVVLLTLAGALWLIRSWGAYRDAFGVSRRRSVAALLLFLLASGLGLRVVGWFVSAA